MTREEQADRDEEGEEATDEEMEGGDDLEVDMSSIPCKFAGLSEKSCIDLVHKLGELDHVRTVPMTTGQEWLTFEQLDLEISQVLAEAGGRLSITELPNEVGVAIQHCEARADHLCKEDSNVMMLHGDLLTTDYLKGVAHEVDISLEETGCHGISDVAVHYNLPTDFVRDEVLAHLATSHHIKQNTIYTSAHAARVEAFARGALRGCIAPLPLSQLASRHRLDADLLATTVQKMLKDGVIQGKLQGSTFTPKVCSDAKENKVDDFFNANQYLLLSLAKSAGINIKDWMQTKQVDGILLSNAFFSWQLAEPVLVSISEAMSSESWVDVMPLLPPSLASSDSRELVQHLASKKKLPANAVVMDHVVISQELLNTIATHFEDEAKAAAERLLTSGSSSSTKPAGRGAADDDEDGGGSKKKGKRAAKGKKSQAEEEKTDGGTGGGDSGIDNQCIHDLLMDQFPELPPDVYEEICSHVQPLLAEKVAAEQATLRAAKESKLKERFEKVEKFVQERYEKLVLGVRALEANEMVGSPLETYLLKETAAEPLHRLLSLRWEDISGASLEVTAANRRQTLDQITSKEGAPKTECLSRLLAFLSGKKDPKAKDSKSGKAAKEEKPSKDSKSGKESKGRAKKGDKGDEDDGKAEDEATDSQDVTELYQAAANECHIFCRKVDKKREKAVLQEQLATFRERLQESSNAVDVCTAGLQLSLLQEGVVGLVFPVECWALRFVAQSLADKDARKDAYVLCLVIEKVEEFRESCPTAPAPPCSRKEYEEEWQSSLTRSLIGRAQKALAALAEEVEDSEESDAVREAAIRAWKERALASK